MKYDLNTIINRDIACSCGKTHRCDIPGLAIGKGALDRLCVLVKEYNKILVVADNNTWLVCGDKVLSQLRGKAADKCVFECEGLLVPDEESIKTIEKCLSEDTELILGIGSGVINDLCKYVSFYHGVKSGIIATATSMDGYASSGAAMILGGMKVTVTTHAPSIIVGDADILCSAPIAMIRSGYADIIGKYSALCDWKLSNFVNGEYLCSDIYDLVMECTNETRAMADKLILRDPDSVCKLMEYLVLIGVCLTLISTTRPGSGSEHHLSHYFEITGLIEDKPYFLHGTDVGYSTVVTAALRKEICSLSEFKFSPVSEAVRKDCYKSIYKHYSGEVAKIQEKAGRYEKPLYDFYSENRDEICNILSVCPSADEIRKMLTDVGFELTEFEKMYGKEKIRNGIFFGKDLKDRYSVLWLYYDLFFNEKEAKRINEGHDL